MGTDQLKRLKELEKEKARLRRPVADLSLEKIISCDIQPLSMRAEVYFTL